MTELAAKKLHPTLDSVQEAFVSWRRTRSFNNKKIPDYLWDQVLKILPNYPKRQLLNTLGLNHSQLKKYLIAFPNNNQTLAKINEVSAKQSKPTTSFIQAFIPPPVSSGYQVEWQRPDGAKLIINQLDTAGLNVLMQQWGGVSC